MSQILVIPRRHLFNEDVYPDGPPTGFFTRLQGFDPILSLIETYGEYRDRATMETSAQFKQIIPQILLTCGNKLFVHCIPQTGTESRLHDLWPIFLGGHVEENDPSFMSAVLREFEEEIDYGGYLIEKGVVGMVNLEDSAVNSVHFGVIFHFKGSSEEFEENGDNGLCFGEFVGWDRAETLLPSMTPWSRAAFPELRKLCELPNKAETHPRTRFVSSP